MEWNRFDSNRFDSIAIDRRVVVVPSLARDFEPTLVLDARRARRETRATMATTT